MPNVKISGLLSFFSCIIRGYPNAQEINGNFVSYFIGTRYHLELLIDQPIFFQFTSLF